MKADVIIVGQGLAGSMLAWHLLQKQHQVLVLDDHHQGSSSLVAAGLINPITGKRLVKSWRVDQCLPAAVDFYRTIEASLKIPLYHEKTILRLFNSQQEREIWEQRRADSDYQHYLGELSSTDDALRGFQIRHSGYLNTTELLTGIKDFLRRRQCLIETRVDYRDFTLQAQEVTWRHVSAKRAIFCEGHRIKDNPWFKTLPLQPAQGEILSLQVANPLPDKIINCGKWLLPIEPNVVKVGATFQWHPLDGVPTAEGKQALLDAYRRLWPVGPAGEVIDHACGVRPGTRDKKPFIGMHPRYPQLGVFNGFGAKGALLIPYYAEIFSNILSGTTRLPEETDITRFGRYL